MKKMPYGVRASSCLILCLCLLCQIARSQSWTLPDASGNINNVNTGNVGIGTTTPGFKLDVTGWTHVNGTFVSDAPLPGNISAWVRGAPTGNSNLVLQGGRGNYEAYWITATNGVLKIGANGGVEPTVGALNIDDNGDVGIGTTTPQAKLAVNGNILTKKVTVSLNNLPDYVFDHNYRLPTLPAVERYIRLNRHLPEMPSADSVARSGLDLGGTEAILLKKVEELTLYVIRQNKKIDALSRKLKTMETRSGQIQHPKK